jgi:hypothetical protein
MCQPARVDLPADQLLHALRLRGKVLAPAADDGVGAAELVAAGFALARGEVLVLTPAGRTEADARFCLVGAPDHEALQTAYDRFLPLNRRLLQLCTDWQVSPGGVPNDHRDPVYDWAVIDRLVTVDEQVGPLVRRLGRRIDRFAPYRDRMREARRRVVDGEADWLLSPRIDSYHTVWMQLHEDLLLGLGRARADESGDESGNESGNG